MLASEHDPANPGDRWPVASPVDAIACPAKVADFARASGFGPIGTTELQIAVSEMCTNILRHGMRGWITFSAVSGEEPGIVVIAEDEGPGFEDVDLARRDGISRGRTLVPSVTPSKRGGLGSGLGALERLADSVEISNRTSGGARVVVFKRLRRD